MASPPALLRKEERGERRLTDWRAMLLWLKEALVRQIVEHGQAEHPCEACGVLLGVGGEVRRVVPITNVADDPLHQYRLDERELARVIGGANGLELAGFYHTHPNSDPIPSPVDVAQAAYPTTPFLIVGLKDRLQPQLAAWLIDYTQVKRIEIQIGDTPAPDDPPTPLTGTARIAILTSALIAFILMIILSLSLLPPAPPIPK